eukprot:9956749-Ditylum_brightwellii.AAC.1
MLAYYLIDGLQLPREDFLQILSDLKKNIGHASNCTKNNEDLLFTFKKALKHAESCKAIKGFITCKLPTHHTPRLPLPNLNNKRIHNPHIEKIVSEMQAANTKEGKITILNRYIKKSEPGGCCLHPGAKTYSFVQCSIVKKRCKEWGIKEELANSMFPPP